MVVSAQHKVSMRWWRAAAGRRTVRLGLESLGLVARGGHCAGLARGGWQSLEDDVLATGLGVLLGGGVGLDAVQEVVTAL